MLTARQAGEIAVIIPAYCPGESLLAVVRDLQELGFSFVVVINDGSGPAYDAVFEAIAGFPNVRVIEHPNNLGKGAALKTGIASALADSPNLLGVVTADADGQHRPGDIVNVARVLRASPQSLVLGARSFAQRVPLRSRIGNTVTRYIVRLVVGQNLSDTQTGLRALPAAFARMLLKLPSSGYDFELDMLIAARNSAVRVLEEPIETVYEAGNKSSHFNPVLDSMRIYFVLARFCSVSLMTALLDNVVFYLMYRRGASLLEAQAAGRSLGLVFNYVMVRSKVFRSGDPVPASLGRYLMLAVGSGTTSYSSIRLLTSLANTPVLLTKLAVETALFFANFIIERDWVFSPARRNQ
jgi:glycosyltransferase involved in cell wall biosynthesis